MNRLVTFTKMNQWSLLPKWINVKNKSLNKNSKLQIDWFDNASFIYKHI